MKYYIKVALQHYAMGLIIPISVIWKLQNGLTLSQAIFTEALVLLVTAIFDLPAGLIANKINNKRSLVIGALLLFIGITLLAIGSSLTIFVIASIFTGAAWAFISGADEAYIHDDYINNPAEYKNVYSNSVIVDEVMTIFGMLSASILLYIGLGLRILFIASSGLLIVHLIYTLFFLPHSKMLPATRTSQTVSIMSMSYFRNNKIFPIILSMVAFAIVYEGLRPLWQPHMQNIGIDIASFGLVFALLKLASLAGSVTARYRTFQKQDISLIFIVMLASFILFSSSVVAISIIALCIYLFTENYFRIFMSTFLNKMITVNRAAILSLGSVIRNGSGALIVILAGLISSSSIALAFIIIAIIKLPAVVYILRMYTLQKD